MFPRFGVDIYRQQSVGDDDFWQSNSELSDEEEKKSHLEETVLKGRHQAEDASLDTAIFSTEMKTHSTVVNYNTCAYKWTT